MAAKEPDHAPQGFGRRGGGDGRANQILRTASDGAHELGASGFDPADTQGAHRNAVVLTPEMSKRLRQRMFLQTALSSSSTM